MSNSTQSYQNHVRWLPPFHFFVMPVLLINFINQVRHLWQAPSLSTTWGVVLAAAFLTLALLARIMALSVQDRVIRLEMRQRLQQILPADLKPKINDLTRQQLVCLRFAGDEEMPELMRQVLAGNLSSSKAIKTSVKNWQSDFLRA